MRESVAVESRSATVLNVQRNEGSVAPVGDLPFPGVRTYPDASPLQADIATWIGCSSEEVVVTAGGDDAIDRIMRVFLGAGRRVAVVDPTFEMIPTYAALTGAEVVRIPWAEEFPTGEFLAVDAAVLAIVTPDNPTGRSVDWAVIETIATLRSDRIILLDQAYVEYGPEDFTERARRYPNIVVVRTFSKAWGLAGLRVGFAVADSAIAQRLRAAGGPYPVSSPAIAAARRCLQTPDYVDEHVRRVKDERITIERTLRELGAIVTPSTANFVFARGVDAQFLVDALGALGVRIRGFARPGLGDAIRVGCPGDAADLDRLCRALRTVLAPEALVFDMDGVLADVRQSYRVAIVQTCASFGVAVTPDDIAAEKRLPNANDDFEVCRRLLAGRGQEVSKVEIEARFQALYDDGLWREEGLLLSRGRLDELGRRYRLAVVTGRPRGDALRFLRTFELEETFSAVICREDAPLKPSPAPVQLAMETLGCTTGWMFGDTVDDVRAASDAGLLSVGVAAPGEFNDVTRAELRGSGAVMTLENVEEVSQWLR